MHCYLRHTEVGINSWLYSIVAAVLRVKLKHLDSWSAARRQKAARYNQLFQESDLWWIGYEDSMVSYRQACHHAKSSNSKCLPIVLCCASLNRWSSEFRLLVWPTRDRDPPLT